MTNDSAPAAQIDLMIRRAERSQSPFLVLTRQMTTPQSPVHHPEGNVWNHTLLVVDRAAAHKAFSADPRVFMWAALLHDIGKPEKTTQRRGPKTAY